MPYLIPATANYFGAMPARSGTGNIQVNQYPVASSHGAIYAGDICFMTAKNTVQSASSGTGSAAATSIVGVAAQYFAANAGSTTQTNTNQILIYDDPAQLFVMCDTSSASIGSSGVGMHFMVCGTGCIGSTGPGPTNRSVMALSGTTASSAGAVKVVAMHPVENNVFATAATGTANVRKYIVSFPNHLFQTGGASTSLLTS